MGTRIVETHRFGGGGEVTVDIELEDDSAATRAKALEALDLLRDRVLRRLGGDPGVVMLGGFKVGDRVEHRGELYGLRARRGNVTQLCADAVTVEFDIGRVACYPADLRHVR